ncbi:MAG: FAD-dependent oxidoreductase [Planctomycetes bacterium]|nr:FAD-dependent oxidoreductase [Planctomycetota bacterium]
MSHRKIVVVGGVAGGASAAAKARREDEHAEITVLERGPYISFANCGLPYYIAGEIKNRDKLLIMTPEKFEDKYNVNVKVNHEVVLIDRANKSVEVCQKDTGERFWLKYDKLILSQGAQPLRPPIPGIEQDHVFTLRDINDMDRIDGYISANKPKSAVVIGGGFIGLEMAEAFAKRKLDVHLVEFAPHVLPQIDEPLAKEFQNRITQHGLNLYTSKKAVSIDATQVELDDGSKVPADLVLVSAGVRPEVELAKKAGLDIGVTGGVKVNARLQTSDSDIFAVGDAAETLHQLTGQRVRMALAGPANRQGRIAGANAVGCHLAYKGSLGTAIVRYEDTTVAMVGINSLQAEKLGYSFHTSTTRDSSHAGYYPGAEMMVIRLLVEDGSGRIMGAQIMGGDGVDKRADVLATAIYSRLSVFDLENLDLSYAPPFGSAQDPVNTAGFVASHIVKGEVNTYIPSAESKLDEAYVMDVREPAELEKFGRLKGAVNIPLSQIRRSLSKIPKDKDVIVYCQKGLRGYVATKILQGHGYERASNLMGGFLMAMSVGMEVEAS